jgi:hypothetical protein
MACSSGDSESTTAEVLSNVIRSKQKGPFTSTDGKPREFTDKAEVDLKCLVEEHADDIAKGKTFVDRRGDAVLRPCLRIPQLAGRRAISRLC